MTTTTIAGETTAVADLDATFRATPAGPIPVGAGVGTAIALRGLARQRFSAIVRRVAWQGKRFTTDDGDHELVNLVSPFSRRAVRAKVYESSSWVDGDPCIVLDYSRTSWIARWVRDEIREVAPGRYLGVVFVRSRCLPLMFTLDFAE